MLDKVRKDHQSKYSSPNWLPQTSVGVGEGEVRICGSFQPLLTEVATTYHGASWEPDDEPGLIFERTTTSDVSLKSVGRTAEARRGAITLI